MKESDMTDKKLSITIRGQVKGGKNNIGITRNGRRFPKASWAKWRDDAARQVKAQWNDWNYGGFKRIPFTIPLNVRLDYFAGDKRRRDMPAIIDAVWHVLEKAGVVADDTLLWAVFSTRDYDKANPRVTITFL